MDSLYDTGLDHYATAAAAATTTTTTTSLLLVPIPPYWL